MCRLSTRTRPCRAFSQLILVGNQFPCLRLCRLLSLERGRCANSHRWVASQLTRYGNLSGSGAASRYSKIMSLEAGRRLYLDLDDLLVDLHLFEHNFFVTW